MMTFALVPIGSSNTLKNVHEFVLVYAGEIGLFFYLEIKEAEQPFGVQHNTAAQHHPPSKWQHKPDVGVPFRSVPCRTKLNCTTLL